MALPRLRHPVVLAHGLLGFSRLFVGIGPAYFRGIEGRLTAAGNRVAAPQVPATGSIERRAEALLRGVRDAFGEERVHVVAHSMGGLDARHAITHLGLAAVSLTTLGTPHRGSPVADRGTDLAKRFRLTESLRAFGLDDAAFTDLRGDGCARFNERTPDVPGVRYASVAGTKPRDAMAVTLRATSDLIGAVPEERGGGPNDGLVGLASARWGEAFDLVEADHFDLVGWTPAVSTPLGRPVDVRSIWEPLLTRLAAWDTV